MSQIIYSTQPQKGKFNTNGTSICAFGRRAYRASSCAGYDQRIEVHGALGMVVAQNQREVSIKLATKDGYIRPPLFDFLMTRYIAAYAAEIAAFVDIGANKSPATASGQDGLKSLKIA